ncbi:MAG: hypothetical protein EON90_11725 [Brevundimonas sp.]|nr:MAG: hypothetical protein EON90_11725 [Brevundimonas sp.]
MNNRSNLDRLKRARLDHVRLYAGSISLVFESSEGLSIWISTNCDLLILGENGSEDYPLSTAAFDQLVKSVDGHVDHLRNMPNGNYELMIGNQTFVIKDDGAPGGIFRLTGKISDKILWDEFY